MACLAWRFLSIYSRCILFVIKSKVSCSGGFYVSFDWNLCCWCRAYFWFFCVNESKYIVTTASKIHGVGAAIGFMALLFFPLLNGIISFKQNGAIEGIISISSFVLSLIFFACFVMGDKEQFQNTLLKYEGLWERLTLFCMYIPFVYKSMSSLFF